MGKLSDLVKWSPHESSFLDVWQKTPALVSMEEFTECASALVAGQALLNKMEEERKALKAPILESGRVLDAKYKPLTKPLEAKLTVMRNLLAHYESQARKDAVKEMEKRTKKLKDRARAEDMKALALTTSVTDAPGVSWTEDIEVEIVDIAQLDPGLVVIDKSKTKTAVKSAYAAGRRVFPGMKVTTVVRPRIVAPAGRDE